MTFYVPQWFGYLHQNGGLRGGEYKQYKYTTPIEWHIILKLLITLNNRKRMVQLESCISTFSRKLVHQN